MQITSLALIFLLITSSASNCLTSSEEYASEVVLPSYDIQRARILGESYQDTIILPSQYDKSLLVVLSESNIPNGLSLRLQRPTQIKELTKPHFRLISYSLTGTLKSVLDPVYLGWRISCDDRQCIFEKDLVSIIAPKQNTGQGVILELNKELPACSSTCTGFCITLTNQSKCINMQMRNDLDTLFRYSNLSLNFRDTFNSYRLTGTQGIILRDILPANTNSIDWQEAMRQELVYLKELGVINIEKKDIESISFLSKESQSGQNYRIVYDKNNSIWSYYDRTNEAILTTDRDCRSFDALKNTPVITPTDKITTFYLIPLILSIIGALLLVILIIIGRLLSKKPKTKNYKRKP